MSRVEENQVMQDAVAEATESFVGNMEEKHIAEEASLDTLKKLVSAHYAGLSTLVLTDISESLAIIADAQMELVKQKREKESGFWELGETDNGAQYGICSACGFKYLLYFPYRYCPKCGRKMFKHSRYTRYVNGEEVDTDGKEEGSED